MVVRRFVTGSFVAALAAPLLLLAACGGSDDSIADPPVSPSSTSSSSPKPPAHESPEAFIRRFAVVERKMENTGDADEYLGLTQRCVECQELANQIHGFYVAGGYVHWDGWTIKSVRPYASGRRPNSYAVRVVSAPTRYRESADGQVKHLDGGPATEIVSIKAIHGSWMVTGRAKLAS
jgi:hypothetical protein